MCSGNGAVWCSRDGNPTAMSDKFSNQSGIGHSQEEIVEITTKTVAEVKGAQTWAYRLAKHIADRGQSAVVRFQQDRADMMVRVHAAVCSNKPVRVGQIAARWGLKSSSYSDMVSEMDLVAGHLGRLVDVGEPLSV